MKLTDAEYELLRRVAKYGSEMRLQGPDIAIGRRLWHKALITLRVVHGSTTGTRRVKVTNNYATLTDAGRKEHDAGPHGLRLA